MVDKRPLGTRPFLVLWSIPYCETVAGLQLYVPCGIILRHVVYSTILYVPALAAIPVRTSGNRYKIIVVLTSYDIRDSEHGHCIFMPRGPLEEAELILGLVSILGIPTGWCVDGVVPSTHAPLSALISGHSSPCTSPYT